MNFFRAFLATSGLAALAFAGPANVLPRIYTQPDSSTLQVTLQGDEHFHYATTGDGYLIARDSAKVFRYVQNDGTLSEVQAGDPGTRSEEEEAFLSEISRTLSLEALRASSTDPIAEIEAAGAATEASSSSLSYRPTAPTYSTGERRFPVILLSTNGHEIQDSALIYRMLNEEGFSEQGMYGSVRDYFIFASDSQFFPTFDLFSVTLDVDLDTATDYAVARFIVSFASSLTSLGFTPSSYDGDGDKTIDLLAIIFAGSENDTEIWAHYAATSVNYKINPKYTINPYLVVPELDTYDTTMLAGIGIFSHEFSHSLGLGDHYDVTTGTGGTYLHDVMAQGLYLGYYGNASARNPPTFNAFERESAGWLTLTELTETDSLLPPIYENFAYSVTNPDNEDEYYVIEYRPDTLWDDEGLYANGVFIWYVNYDEDIWEANTINVGDEEHFKVVPASDSYWSYAPFPGATNTTEFDGFVFETGSADSAGLALYSISLSSEYASFHTWPDTTSDTTSADSSEVEEESDEDDEVEEEEGDESGIALNHKAGVSASWGALGLALHGAQGELLRIYDLKGKLVYSAKISSGSEVLNPGLGSAAYIVRVGANTLGIFRNF